jgi:hypothetical protein
VASNGNTGIGTDSPSYKLHVTGDIRGSESFFLNDGKAVQWGGTDARIVGSSGGDYVRFYTAGTQRWEVNSSGNLVSSGGAIDFGSGATLDDYETGTATVAFSSGGGSVTINSSNNTIRYIKVGKLVHIHGEITVSSVSSPSGDLQITGLPFPSARRYRAGWFCGKQFLIYRGSCERRDDKWGDRSLGNSSQHRIRHRGNLHRLNLTNLPRLDVGTDHKHN